MKFLSFSLNIASFSNDQFCLKRWHKGSEPCLLQGLVAVFCPRSRLSFTMRLITAKLQVSLETMWQLFPPTDRFDNWWNFPVTRSMILGLDTWWLKDVGGILAGGLLLFHVRSKGCLAVVLLNILVSVLNKWSWHCRKKRKFYTSKRDTDKLWYSWYFWV